MHRRPTRPDAASRDEDLEARFAFAQETVGAPREVRTRSGVAPSARMPIVLKTDGASAAATDRPLPVSVKPVAPW